MLILHSVSFTQLQEISYAHQFFKTFQEITREGFFVCVESVNKKVYYVSILH